MFKQNRIYLLFFITMLVMVFPLMLQATYINASGAISSNTVWSGVDSIRVTGDITVNNGITLTINPGIKVSFQGHYYLKVNGRLLAVGNSSNLITFTNNDHTTGWNRIIFDNTPATNDSSKIVYCTLEYGKTTGTSMNARGGAIFVYAFSKLLISNCTFQNNTATVPGGAGGAIYISAVSLINLSNCVFKNNTATMGGAIRIDSNAILKNLLIYNNTATIGQYGGGIYLSTSNPTILNCSVVNNTNCGIRCSSNSSPIIRNTIIYGNSDYNLAIFGIDHNNPNVYYSDVQGGLENLLSQVSGYSGTYENNINSNPQFVGSGLNPYDLLMASPCINTGDPTTTTTTVGAYDIGGGSRIINGRIEMGAYEEFKAPGTTMSNCLTFDGTDDYVSGTGINTSRTAITIEAWIYHNTLQAGEIQRYVAVSPEVAVIRYDASGEGGYRSLHFYLKKADGTFLSLRADSVLTTGEWMHVAGTFDGINMKLYLNGNLLKSSTITGGLYSLDGNFKFSDSSETLDGKIDEVRIWNCARTQQQIRECMYLPLNGTETGLENYWQFNESSGTIATDAANCRMGTLNNMSNSNWITSTVPFGSGISNTQTEATGVVTFTGTDFSMNYTAHNSASVTVTKLNTNPNLIPTGVNEVFDNQYWIANRYGTGSFNGNMTLTISEDLTADDQSHPNQIRLYSRESNSDGSWLILTSAISVNADSNQATFSGISNTGQFLVCRSYPTTSSTVGTALIFDGSNEYINLGNSSCFDVGSVLTIEAWIKPNNLTGRYGIFSTRKNNQPGSFQLEIGTGGGGTGRVAVSGVNTWVAQTDVNAISTGEWVHIAYTRSGTGAGTHKIYVNGVLQTLLSDDAYAFINNSSDKVIGSGTNTNQLFNGSMDEVRIWNVVRTDDQIRERMYLPLTGTEVGLVSYWQFNEATGTQLNDFVSINNGTMINMGNENWLTSTLPFSVGISNSQTEATGTVTFTGTGLSSFFTTANDARLTVAKLNGSPNVNPTEVTSVYDDQYWEMNRFGAGIFSANLTFTLNEDLTMTNQSKPNDIKLYSRSSSSDASWLLVSSAISVNASMNTATFNDIMTTGQFILAYYQSNSLNITPTSITQSLYVGDQASIPLSIENTSDQPVNYSISVDASSSRNSTISTRGSGVPGSYTYSWIDSDQDGGPAFNWIDISSVGTEIITNWWLDYGDSDDGYKIMDMPFNFPYFNSSYNQVQISTNGLLTFNTGYNGSDIDSYPIPDANEPNNLIAAYWEDLSAETSDAHIYFYDDSSNNRVIIEYQNYSHYYTSGYFETFEVILNSDGCITMQYLNASALNNLCAVGIENQDGTQGLQIVRNASYIHSNLAIRICPMISVNAWSGTVNASSTNHGTIQLASDALWAGDFTGNVIITSDEPGNPQYTIPISLHVNPPQTLGIPQNLAIEMIGQNVKLSWDAVYTASSYKVFVSNFPNENYSEWTGYGTFGTERADLKSRSTRITWTCSRMGNRRLFYYVKAVR